MMFGRKYFMESLAWIVAFVISIELAQWLAESWPAGSPLRLVALAPVVVALCAGLWVELRQVARMDELHRLMYLVATLTGSILVILFCALAHLGEALQIWGRVSPIYAIAVLGAGFVVGWFGAKRRYA
jgi:hypothetical protein